MCFYTVSHLSLKKASQAQSRLVSMRFTSSGFEEVSHTGCVYM